MYEIREDNNFIIRFHYHEIGPLNMPENLNFNIIKESIRNISSTPVTSNWWCDFSTWEDYHGLFRTGTTLSVHSVVSEISR